MLIKTIVSVILKWIFTNLKCAGRRCVALIKFLHMLIMLTILFLSLVVLPGTGTASASDSSYDTHDNERTLTIGQENIVLRARQVYEIEWTPLRDVITWARRGVFRAGETVQGLPYGMPPESNYVPYRTSFSEFLENVNDRNSGFYRSIAKRHQDAPFYSLDCSAFVSYAWGLEERLMTGALPSVATNMGIDMQTIQVGDALNNPGLHVVLVTEIRYDEDNEISTIGIMELNPPKATYTLYGEDGDFPLSDVRRRYLNNGFSILRYNERENVVYLHDCVVPIDGDYCNKCNETGFLSRLQFLDSQQGVHYLDIVKFIEQTGALSKDSRKMETYDFEITRGMFVHLLSKHVNADVSIYYESVFEDVPIDEWYAQSIAWIVDVGLIDSDNERFEPRQLISNEEIAYIMYNYLLMKNKHSKNPNPALLMHKTEGRFICLIIQRESTSVLYRLSLLRRLF